MQTRFSGSAFGASSVFSLRRTFFLSSGQLMFCGKEDLKVGFHQGGTIFPLSFSLSLLFAFFLSLLLCLSPFIFFLSYSYFLSLSDKVSFLGMSLLLSLSLFLSVSLSLSVCPFSLSLSLSLSVCLFCSLFLSLQHAITFAIFPPSHNSIPSGIS